MVGMRNLNHSQGLYFLFYFIFVTYPFHLHILKCDATMLLSVHGITKQNICASVSFIALYHFSRRRTLCCAGTGGVELMSISNILGGYFHTP